MACGAQVRTYPLMTRFPADPDGSGWEADAGSGMDVPLYDEFFAPMQIFDFTQSANLTDEKICECENETQCVPDDGNIIRLDEMITLVFCGDVRDLFRRPCRGARNLIRVIGQIHASGEALLSVTETLLFCKCERGYQRIRVEAWRNDLFAFVYQCSS
ncbi:unnamed protein product [Gongylonema pulchrum]|uniref:Uncharacterized protein n=1 Tax=Gongylonema pulchrum TaxID=637853 RepID=A0A183E9F5_9BILA|nr:unnamed protein product [Gongylonema pulchrum]